MRGAAVLVLVALLKAQGLRTEPLEFTAAASKDRNKDVQVPRALNANDMQDWARLPPADEAYRRFFNVDLADLEDDREDYEYPDEQLKSIDQLDDVQLQRMTDHLLKVLQRPNIYEAPVLFIKDPINELDNDGKPELDGLRNVAKKSRIYRQYPWKRENSSSYKNVDYDPYNTCILTRKDVFELLVAVHDARQGNKSRIVNFCKRKRLASAVYTNIRFLGRRRK